MRSFIYSLLFPLILGGCSSALTAKPPQEFHITTLELFLSRTNLRETDFEQYKIEDDRLFLECGKILRGRFLPAEQDFVSLTPEQRAPLSEATWRFLNTSKDFEFDPPGKLSGLFDPGQLHLSLNSDGDNKQIRTSLDSIVHQNTFAETSLYRLASSMRALAGSKLCGNQNFYGLK